MNILIIALVVALGLALALWVASLPRTMPAYTRPTFYLAIVVAAVIVIFMNVPA